MDWTTRSSENMGRLKSYQKAFQLSQGGGYESAKHGGLMLLMSIYQQTRIYKLSKPGRHVFLLQSRSLRESFCV